MLPIELFEKTLNRNEQTYSKAELSRIREFLYQIATIEFQEYKKSKDGNKCGVIHQSVHR